MGSDDDRRGGQGGLRPGIGRHPGGIGRPLARAAGHRAAGGGVAAAARPMAATTPIRPSAARCWSVTPRSDSSRPSALRVRSWRSSRPSTAPHRRSTPRRDEELTARFESAEIAAEQERQDAQWEATTIAEAAKGGSGLELADIQAELDARWHELQAIARQAVELLRRRGQWRHYPDPAFSGSLLERHPAQRFVKARELAREQYRALAARKVSHFFTGVWPTMVLFVFLWGALVYPAGYLLGWREVQWVVLASGGAAFPVFLLLFLWLHRLARRHSTQAYLPLRRTLLEAGVDRPAVLETAKNDCRRLHAAIAARYNAEIRKAEERFTAALAAMTAARQQGSRQADETYQPRLAAMVAQRDQALAARGRQVSAADRRLGKRLCRRVAGAGAAARRGDRSQPAAVRATAGRNGRPLADRPRAVSGRLRADGRGLRPALSPLGRPGVAALDAAGRDPAGDPLRALRRAAGADRRRTARGRRPAAAAERVHAALALALPAAIAVAAESGRRRPRQGRPGHPGRSCCGCSPRCRRARSASRSSIRSGWARTSPPSCTWPITTSNWSPAASGPTPPTSSSGWPTSPTTWRT